MTTLSQEARKLVLASRGYVTTPESLRLPEEEAISAPLADEPARDHADGLQKRQYLDEERQSFLIRPGPVRDTISIGHQGGANHQKAQENGPENLDVL
jgi:hypothetical protein